MIINENSTINLKTNSEELDKISKNYPSLVQRIFNICKDNNPWNIKDRSNDNENKWFISEFSGIRSGKSVAKKLIDMGFKAVGSVPIEYRKSSYKGQPLIARSFGSIYYRSPDSSLDILVMVDEGSNADFHVFKKKVASDLDSKIKPIDLS